MGTMMFTVEEVPTERGILQYRRENLTGLKCRVSCERSKRGMSAPAPMHFPMDGCPFCPGTVTEVTPTFPNGRRIHQGESVTFPNLFPFAPWHTVTVITREHMVDLFTRKQISDALLGQLESLRGRDGYPSINWNYLPSSGASIPHPHLQGLVDYHPSTIPECYILGSHRYLLNEGRSYWEVLKEEERASPRYLFG
ncbi:MAG TPA: galactose-1-phosphate uridylyltransferase, partial [Methanomicrobiales archaeon]|nr:galactose-1-phosphate uridylyltransferase [Methanomicrobiales archaeon]